MVGTSLFGSLTSILTGLIVAMIFLGGVVWFMIKGHTYLEREWRPMFLGIMSGIIAFLLSEFVFTLMSFQKGGAELLALSAGIAAGIMIWRTAWIKYSKYSDRLTSKDPNLVMTEDEIDAARITDLKRMYIWLGVYVVVAAIIWATYYFINPFDPASVIGQRRLSISLLLGIFLAVPVTLVAKVTIGRSLTKRREKAEFEAWKIEVVKQARLIGIADFDPFDLKFNHLMKMDDTKTGREILAKLRKYQLIAPSGLPKSKVN